MGKYDIIVKESEWEKMRAYTELCSTEVACFGLVTAENDGKGDHWLYVDTMFLVPQEVSGAEVDFVTKGLPFAVNYAMELDRVEDLRFCAHSHVNMGTGFSSTDDDMIEKIGKGGTPWFASAIFNKRGETNARVDLFPNGMKLGGIGQVKVEARVMSEATIPVLKDAKDELKKFVVEKPKVEYATKGNWTQPMKSTAGGALIPSGMYAGDWMDRLDDEEERRERFQTDLALWILAREEDWPAPMQDSEGEYHFVNKAGGYEGSAGYVRPETIAYFMELEQREAREDAEYQQHEADIQDDESEKGSKS